MALLRRQQSLDGRTSRASMVSTQSRAAGSRGPSASGDTLDAAAPGVLSMLKTSTDVGDVGEFSHNTGRLPAALRPTHQRRNHPSRLSSSSNQSSYTYHTNHSHAPSHGSRKAHNSHNPQTWDAVSAISGSAGIGMSVRNGSMISVQTLPTMPPYDNRAPPMSRGHQRSAPYGPPMAYPQDGRSYSLTHSNHAPSIRPTKSVTSLNSQGGAQFQPPRPPFAYPGRFKRAGFRTPSPALSDYTGGAYQGAHGPVQAFGDDLKHPIEQNMGHYSPHDSTYPHHQVSAPLDTYQGHPSDRNYGQPPGRSMNRSNTPMYSNNNYQYTAPSGPRYQSQPQPTMHHHQATHNYQDHPFYIPYPPHDRHLPPFDGYGPMNNGAPPPMDFIPSSSEQMSSSPPSSNPPTPRNATTVQVAIDPALVDPALSELPNEHSEYKNVQSYLRYTEQSVLYELDAVQPAAVELEASPAATTRTGFVQRIRNLLEDRAASQELFPPSPNQTQQDVSKLIVPQPFQTSTQDLAELPASKRSSVHEPVELDVPARITRQLIKANTAPSSSEQNTTTSIVPEETFKVKDKQAIKSKPSKPSVESGHAPVSAGASQGLYLNYSEKQTTVTLPAEAPSHGVQITLSEPIALVSTTDPPAIRIGDETPRDSRDFEAGRVSPLHPDGRIVRDSVVSPMATQTMQITAIQEQPPLSTLTSGDAEGSENAQPQRFSKQTFDTTEMASGLSLPTGPHQTFETNSSSGHVTDVAVKFSVPRSSDHGRAQLVNLSNFSDTPARVSVELKKARSAEDNSLYNSFASIEKVAPLRIRRMQSFSPMATGTEGTDLSSFIRRSFPRKKSMWSTAQTDPNRLSTDSTTDLGPAALKARPGYLPDLNEDSKEDMSVRNTKSTYTGLRLSGTPSLRLKPSLDASNHLKEVPQSSYLAPRPPRMSLSELREIPSLNFSRMDLFDKLNEELETHISRSSKSLAGVKGERKSSTRRSSLLHPASTDQIRERYGSFFTDNDASELVQDSTVERLDVEDEVKAKARQLQESNQHDADIASTKSFARSYRPMSTQQMLSVASEVDRLQVPSVAALSARLSTLLPSIKHLHIDCAPVDQTTINDAIDRIHRLGRPESGGVPLLRSSTGLRHLAAVADDIAMNGTHDSTLLEAQKSGRLMKELPPLPEDCEKFSLSDSGLDRNTTLITEGLTTTSEIEAPKPALLRVQSLGDIDSKGEDLHPGFTSRNSLVFSAQSLRPWNIEENYPWCGNSPGININFPTPVLRRHSSPPKLTHAQSRGSNKTQSETEETLDPDSTLPSSPMMSNSETITPTVLTVHHRKSSKKSLIGSLSRRIGLNARSQSTSAAREVGHTERASPGDRYPYTSLQSPQTLNMEEVRSFFSDSTSEEHTEERRGSFRKQITSFRTRSSKVSNGQAPASAPYSQSLDIHRARSLDQYGRPSQVHTTGSLFDDHRFTEPVTPQNYDGMVGMGRVEFRVKRVAERLRHIWQKGGEMIRSISQRSRASKRQHREREAEVDNWLADSLYSRD